MKLFSSVVCLFVVTVLVAGPVFTNAASLYIDPPLSTLYRGDAINYSIRLDTDEAIGECVNTVDATISYPETLDPVDVSTGDSILSMWVEQPTINAAERTITFAGGIPNGYCGRVEGDPRLTNVLAQVIFRSPGFIVGQSGESSNQAELSFAPETIALLNDGFGTPAQLTTYPAKIELADGRGEVLVNPWQDRLNEDTIPPEKFSIFLEKQDKSDKYFIVFNTSDKQTVIDIYQVMEEPLSQIGSFDWGRADAPWVEARSPYILKDQNLNSTIRVKAIDKAGNEYIATLVPEESLRTEPRDMMMNLIVLMFGGVALLVLLMIGFFLFRKKKQAKNVEEVPEELAYENEEEVTDTPE